AGRDIAASDGRTCLRHLQGLDGSDALSYEDETESANRDESPRTRIQLEEDAPAVRNAAVDRKDAGMSDAAQLLFDGTLSDRGSHTASTLTGQRECPLSGAAIHRPHKRRQMPSTAR